MSEITVFLVMLDIALIIGIVFLWATEPKGKKVSENEEKKTNVYTFAVNEEKTDEHKIDVDLVNSRLKGLDQKLEIVYDRLHETERNVDAFTNFSKLASDSKTDEIEGLKKKIDNLEDKVKKVKTVKKADNKDKPKETAKKPKRKLKKTKKSVKKNVAKPKTKAKKDTKKQTKLKTTKKSAKKATKKTRKKVEPFVETEE